MDNNKVNTKGERTVNIIMIICGLIVAAVVTHFCCTSCSVQKPTIVYRDSVRVEYKDRIIHDSVAYQVPVEVEKIVTKDTASHLENTYAESDAVVSEGLLYHSLSTRPYIIKVPVEVVVHDTLVYESHGQVITETKYVEKELTWWQKFQMRGFWWLLLAVLGLVVWIFRKPIVAFIKALFGKIF